ncbi:MAG: DUF2147 domain-containing protein [Steroidobacterales bacterium]
MRSLIISLVVAVLVSVAALRPAQATDLQSPLGLWKTIDDKTGAPRAIVRIFAEDDKYFGRIEQSFTPGASTRVCAVCTDDRKNHPIIGLQIIRGMVQRNDEFAGGEILDPDSGWIYRCKFHLQDGGQKLIVRGYLGISLFGRSQTWVREP